MSMVFGDFGINEEEHEAFWDRSRRIKINLRDAGAKLQALRAFKDQVVYYLRDRSRQMKINRLEAKLRDEAFHAFKDQVIHHAVLHSATSDIEMLLQRDKKCRVPRLEIRLKQQERSSEKIGLHIAARQGHEEKILKILRKNVDLITHEDPKGDLPLHEAARAGQLNAVVTLTLFMQEFVKPELSIGKANKEGNTPLHLAVQNGHDKVAWFLIRRKPDTSYSLNEEGISPLYLAIEARFPNLVQHMLYSHILPRDYLDQTSPKKSVAHAAVRARDKAILGIVLNKLGPLFNSFDEEGRTPLSYAAHIGYFDGVIYILSVFPDSAFSYDKDGSYPIHNASDGGHVKIVEQFLLRFPKIIHSLNGQGQNILHLAAKSGKTNMVSHLLKLQGIKKLMDMKDKDGDTALHLATKFDHLDVVSCLEIAGKRQ